jgi:DNA repair protein RadC
MKTYKSDMPEITLKYKTGNYKKTKISTSLDAFQVLLQLYDDDTVDYKETAYALFLNKANNTIGWMKISEGGTSSTIIDQKIIFATALKCNASGIILSHNHPSGQLRASDEDRKMTDRIVSIGFILGIEVLDHVIVCRSGYYSMSDEGEI